MKPRKLYMRNFMCYREQELDFSGIHLACLTGGNGHGKSAILDALTWVLWGYSRLGARRDDELIHIGQREMEVEFEFALPDVNAGDSDIRYRVLRKRDSRRRGQSGLELQGWDAQEGRFRSLSEPTISATQRKIDGLLHMGYDTFINSAFLLQGRADEFTIKGPAERKRVLGNILGLEMYDAYERLAKESAQGVRGRADQLLAVIAQIDKELELERGHKVAAQTAKAELDAAQRARANAEIVCSTVRGALEVAKAATAQLVGVETRLGAARVELGRITTEKAALDARLVALEDALLQETEIETGYAVYQRAYADAEIFNAKLSELVMLNEQRSEAERRITAARHALDVERRAAAERVRQLTETAAGLEQEKELLEVQAELDRLDEREAEREKALIKVQALGADIAAWNAENKRARLDAAQIKEKISFLMPNGGEGALPESARCPLCGQSLAADGCARLLDGFEAELETGRAAYAERVTAIQAGQQRTRTLQALCTEIGRELSRRGIQQRTEAALAHSIQAARTARDALPAADAALAEIDQQLADSTYAQKEQEALAEIEQQLGKLGYDETAHCQAKDALETARPNEARMDTLREARIGAETLRLALSQLRASQIDTDNRVAADEARVIELRESADDLSSLQRREEAAQQVLKTARDREQQANVRLGAARSALERCGNLREQRATQREQEQLLREEQGIYEELQGAFGKKGVQAMLIELAIPDIEQEANRLLARMTRGAMQVRFETLRDTRRGDTVETLDIHISDSRGTRAYETFSGGERYRINFAIRIALSKLLARRAGAQLRMLVIDEGFGTQDSMGRDGLISALHAVRDDFSCVLAITHVEELKDAFSVRIEVEKTAEGSTITIV